MDDPTTWPAVTVQDWVWKHENGAWEHAAKFQDVDGHAFSIRGPHPLNRLQAASGAMHMWHAYAWRHLLQTSYSVRRVWILLCPPYTGTSLTGDRVEHSSLQVQLYAAQMCAATRRQDDQGHTRPTWKLQARELGLGLGLKLGLTLGLGLGL